MGNAYNTHCFNKGFDEGNCKSQTFSPNTEEKDKIHCTLNALPCILRSDGYKSYVEGYNLGVNCNNRYSGDVPENGDTHTRGDGKIITYKENKWI